MLIVSQLPCDLQGFQEMNYLGNFLLLLRKLIILRLYLMGTMTLPKWIKLHICFMMLLMYDMFSCLFSFPVSHKFEFTKL